MGPIEQAMKAKNKGDMRPSVMDYSQEELQDKQRVTDMTDIADLLSNLMPAKGGMAAGAGITKYLADIAASKLLPGAKNSFSPSAIQGALQSLGHPAAGPMADLMKGGQAVDPELTKMLLEEVNTLGRAPYRPK